MKEKLCYVDRIGSGCTKWDLQEGSFGETGLMGLWVADMDFRIPEAVREATVKYAEYGIYGYAPAPESYYEAFIRWEKKKHGFTPKRAWLRYSPGVVPGFYWCVQRFTEPGDAVIVQTPVYYPFLDAVRKNGRKLVTSELRCENGVYSIDFADFEEKIVENDVKLFIFCSPHNPVGRVWTKEELTRLFDICRRHDVFIVSDEIHHDLILGDKPHIPSLSLLHESDRCVAFTAPSKTFNLAGLQNAVMMAENEEILAAWDSYVPLEKGSPIGYIAAETAWREGEEWLEAVLDTVRENEAFVRKTLLSALPELRISPLEGTYLMWLNFESYLKAEEMADFFQKKCRLAFDYGSWFGGNAACCIRMNLATCKENLAEACRRIIENLQ